MGAGRGRVTGRPRDIDFVKATHGGAGDWPGLTAGVQVMCDTADVGVVARS